MRVKVETLAAAVKHSLSSCIESQPGEITVRASFTPPIQALKHEDDDPRQITIFATLIATLTLAATVAASCGGAGSDADTLDTQLDDPPATEPANTEPANTETPATEPAPTAPVTTEPPETSPPATDPSDEPPTTDSVLGADSVKQEFGSGFVALDVWPGWELEESSEEISNAFEEVGAEVAWTFDVEDAEVLFGLASDETRFGILRERRPGVVGSYDDFRESVRTFFGDGQPPRIESPVTWAGLDGHHMSFDFGAVRTAEVDWQYVLALSLAIDTEELAESVYYRSSAISE